ncbi:serine/threonine-protein kinase [Enhygromyxa salina]|uniref:Serine/threonine-protein kinase PknA n=1 Tax=Enhygromyxa salina TaxID=215803 RepID=A0A2S9YJ60_9BACT|nr:serine/threonine-protein kinase [Enhygromyxa salina]PRQ05147.1 Serine/threonine-protein kinase PknA [Enhygromyxa salina]
MVLLRTDTFQKSFEKLNREKALRVEHVLEKLRADPQNVSFSTLRASGATLRVVRVGRATRLVLGKVEEDLLLLYVGAHDDAFRWVDRASLSPEALSSKAASSKPVESPTDTIEVPDEPSENPVVIRLEALSDDEVGLLELGPAMIGRLRATRSEEDIMELVEEVEAVSPTLAEALLRVLLGESPAEIRREIFSVTPRPKGSERLGAAEHRFRRYSADASASWAFSSHLVVARYPAPIALAWSRFCACSEPRTRLEALFFALESTVKFLCCVALAELVALCAQRGDEVLLHHGKLKNFEKQQRTMLGGWTSLLRHLAETLADEEPGFVDKLPEVCGSGTLFDRHVDTIKETRNDVAHAEGSIAISSDECLILLEELRPRMEVVLSQSRFLCETPLAFAQRHQFGARSYLQVFGCMGAAAPSSQHFSEIDAESLLGVRSSCPFLVSSDATKIRYLWPFVHARRSAVDGEPGLYLFKELQSGAAAKFLARVHCSGIRSRDPWQLTLAPEPKCDFTWLLKELDGFPHTQTVAPDPSLATLADRPSIGRLIDKTVGDCLLHDVIAAGGFGVVYLAHSNVHGQVAVKVLENVSDTSTRNRFLAEIEKMQELSHPNLIDVLDHGTENINGRMYPWYAMPFADGGDLRRLIQQRVRRADGEAVLETEAERVQLRHQFSAVCQGLGHLHSRGHVHRDVKPANVLLMNDGSIRLADFGLVKSLNPTAKTLGQRRMTSIGAVLGTDDYMAPEQRLGRDVETSADIFSLGILLGELLFGRCPQQEPVDTGSPLSSSSEIAQLPVGLRDLLIDSTNVDPEERPDIEQVHRRFLEGMR